MRRAIASLSLTLILTACAKAPAYDFLLVGGTVIDGTGKWVTAPA